MLDLKVPTETREVGFSMYAAVDIWSTGILIASMFLGGKNLFMPDCDTKTKRSKSKKEELRELIRVCGMWCWCSSAKRENFNHSPQMSLTLTPRLEHRHGNVTRGIF